MSQCSAPTLEHVEACARRLGQRIRRTPVVQHSGSAWLAALNPATEIFVKLELFQVTGSFKARGALNVIGHLSAEQLEKGVTAVSAGNHAIATAYAAREYGAQAKVVMPKAANPYRVERARFYGAEVIMAADGKEAFAIARRLEQDQGLAFVHPFEGPLTAEGTGTISLEFSEQAGPLDALIIPIGGGGLCGGMAAAMKQLQPDCLVFGVEPEGADTMHRSFAAGEPVSMESVKTIADSLAPPMSLPYSFGLCHANVDDLVLVSDQDMQQAMAFMFRELKLAVEPAGAAATAALLGPLSSRLSGKRVGVIACGGNMDVETFTQQIKGF